MLANSPYVRLVTLDFSRAFDTVRHRSLFQKLATMSLPDEVYNWIRNFYDHRSHCTRSGGELSDILNILASMIQRSALGPASYVVNTGDLRPVTIGNEIIKYADDTYLIVPAENTSSCQVST